MSGQETNSLASHKKYHIYIYMIQFHCKLSLVFFYVLACFENNDDSFFYLVYVVWIWILNYHCPLKCCANAHSIMLTCTFCHLLASGWEEMWLWWSVAHCGWIWSLPENTRLVGLFAGMHPMWFPRFQSAVHGPDSWPLVPESWLDWFKSDYNGEENAHHTSHSN